MSNTPTDSWTDWIHAFRERFIAKQGWTEKEAKLRIRDAWAVVRDGRIHVLANDSERPAGAVPVFRTLTAGGWKLPIGILDRLTGLVGKALSSNRSPRDIVLGLLSLVDPPDDQNESDEIKQKRHSVAFWGYQLLDACEDETLAGVIGSDAFWQALLYAYLAGRRHTILELYRDPRLFDDLIKAQAFQCGRSPDELTRRLEASWLELRTELGHHPKPREVAEAASGEWSEIDDCWQFDHLDGLPSVPSGALYDRLDKIRRKHS